MFVSRRRLAEGWLKTSFVGSHSQRSLGMHGELELLPTAARFEYGTRNVSVRGPAIESGAGSSLC